MSESMQLGDLKKEEYKIEVTEVKEDNQINVPHQDLIKEYEQKLADEKYNEEQKQKGKEQIGFDGQGNEIILNEDMIAGILNKKEALEHTGKSSDSFAMKLVKERLKDIETLNNDVELDEDVKKCRLQRTLMGLRQASLMYKASRFADGRTKNRRHEIVQSLIGDAEAALLKIEDVDDVGVVSMGYVRSRNALKAYSSNKSVKWMLTDLNAIDALLAKEVPGTAEAFEAKKKDITDYYNALIMGMKKEAEDTGCYTSASQSRYRAVSEMLLQLQLERNQLRAMTFSGLSENLKKGLTWENILSNSGVTVVETDLDMTARRGRMDVNMSILGQVLGVDLYVQYEKGTVPVRSKKGGKTGRDVSMELPHEKYLTKSEIMAIAKENNMEVIYSDKTMLDLTSIQMLDLIAGVKDRSQDTLGFKFREKKTGGRYVMELYDVHVLFTKGGFGRSKAAKFNDRGRTGDYRIYDPTQADAQRFIQMSGYDLDLADKLIYTPSNVIIESMTAMGYVSDEEEKKALEDRLEAVRDALRADMYGGIRYNGYGDVERKSQPNKEARERAKRFMFDRIKDDPAGNLYLIDRQLVSEGKMSNVRQKIREENLGWKEEEKKKPQTENERFAKKLNSVADKESISGQKRRRAKKDIAKQANDAMFAGASKMLTSIKDHIVYYSSMNHTASDMDKIALGKKYKEIFDRQMEDLGADLDLLDNALEKLFELPGHEQDSGRMPSDAPLPDQNAQAQNQPVSKEEREKQRINYYKNRFKWADGTEGLMDEKHEIFNILSWIRAYRGQLDRGEVQMSQEQKDKELECLDKFEKLFDFTKGTLDTENIPRGAKILNDANVTYSRKKDQVVMQSVAWTPLFEHEPCLEDIKQGNLGDCYLLASLGALVEQDPESIKGMFRDNGDTVTVRLYSQLGKPYYITMKKELPLPRVDGGDIFARGAFWVMYIEKAFTMMKGENGENKRDYDKIDGGIPFFTLRTLTGKSGGWNFSMLFRGIDHALIFDKLENKTDEEIGEEYKDAVDSLIEYITNEKSKGKALVASTRAGLDTGDTGSGLNGEHMGRGYASGHAYTLIGVDVVNGKKMIRLHNPWGYGRIRYEVQKDSDVMVTRWGDDMEPGDFYMTPERFIAVFGDIATAK